MQRKSYVLRTFGVEAEHRRGRQEPGLGSVIGNAAQLDMRLFIDVARAGLFEALVRLDKAGSGRRWRRTGRRKADIERG
jgi:hypothetical protein